MSGKVNTVLSPRESGSFIAANCEHVTINEGNIKKTAEILADAFRSENLVCSNWRKHALHPKNANEKAIDLIFAIDVLNFSFWPDVPEKNYVVKYNSKSYNGYWSLVAALRRAEEEGIPVYSADYMANIEREEFAHVFRSDSDVEISLLEERLNLFNESGNVLLCRFGGTFVNCVKQCNKDAVALLNIIVTNFQGFRDESLFNGTRVSFYKRAQILVADIWCCFEGKGLGEFNNIDQLTMFADYRVPQALEYFGILQYSEKLKEALNKRTVISQGHRYELEIRGCSIESTERLTNDIRKILNAEGMQKETQHGVTAVTVDNYLWDYAKDHKEDMKHLEYHLVRTIYY